MNAANAWKAWLAEDPRREYTKSVREGFVAGWDANTPSKALAEYKDLAASLRVCLATVEDERDALADKMEAPPQVDDLGDFDIMPGAALSSVAGMLDTFRNQTHVESDEGFRARIRDLLVAMDARVVCGADGCSVQIVSNAE